MYKLHHYLLHWIGSSNNLTLFLFILWHLVFTLISLYTLSTFHVWMFIFMLWCFLSTPIYADSCVIFCIRCTSILCNLYTQLALFAIIPLSLFQNYFEVHFFSKHMPTHLALYRSLACSSPVYQNYVLTLISLNCRLFFFVFAQTT